MYFKTISRKKKIKARNGGTLLIPTLNPRRHRHTDFFEFKANLGYSWFPGQSGLHRDPACPPPQKDRTSYLDLQLTYLASITGQ